MGTHWELEKEYDGNKGKMTKKSCPHQKLKREKKRHFELHAEPSDWLHEISISKTVRHHFWPGLIPPL
jgi:hypothetical protein